MRTQRNWALGNDSEGALATKRLEWLSGPWVARAACTVVIGFLCGLVTACDVSGDRTQARQSNAKDHAHDHGEAHSHNHDGHVHSHDDGDHPHDPANGDGQAHDGLDHAHQHPASDPNAACTCDAAKLHNGWCRTCNWGYVAGVKVENAKLFETMDPHGHELDTASLTCATCRAALVDDGFCNACGMGFMRGLAYFSRFTHGLATGEPSKPETFSCSTCRTNAGSTGWCETCRSGMIGNVKFINRAGFDAVRPEFGVFQAAIAKAGTCELCACAMIVHRTCPSCLISYEEVGGLTPVDAPAARP